MTKRFGQGDYVYELVPGWGALPSGWEYKDVVGIREDSRGRIVVFNRGTHPVVVFDRDGKLLTTWGDGVFTRPHGLQIGPDGTIYCVDDQDHTVRAFTPDGKLRLTLGTPGHASQTGWISSYDTLPGGGPFNRPTNIAVASNGDLYVSDGYGNCRVHRFGADGTHKESWGSAGQGAGQFRLPHGVCAEPFGSVLVGDRANDRIQRFDLDGRYLGEWTGVRAPDDIFRDASGAYYVAELGKAAAVVGDLGARVTIRNRHGHILSAWGDEGDPASDGNFAAPHAICVDAHGDLYVGEVTFTARISRGLVGPDTHRLQKFARVH
ncbi:MAG: hypothetical protein EPO26_01985 [Chloroflexota bacterium]|nr:MAG: hypothetical protein EPO26_01985 [Chloroflexota bacterium]